MSFCDKGTRYAVNLFSVQTRAFALLWIFVQSRKYMDMRGKRGDCYGFVDILILILLYDQIAAF